MQSQSECSMCGNERPLVFGLRVCEKCHGTLRDPHAKLGPDDQPARDKQLDAEMSELLKNNLKGELAREDAARVVAFYNTLAENDIPTEAATQLTFGWMAAANGLARGGRS